MGRVFEHLKRGMDTESIDEDEFLPISEEGLDSYAYEYEQEMMHAQRRQAKIQGR